MIIKPRGRVDAPIVVVSGAPTVDDDRYKTAFSGDQGQVVQDLVRRMGFDLNDVVFVTTIQQRKVSRAPWTPTQIKAAADEYLLPFILKFQRKIIIPLGNAAAFAVGATKTPEGINSVRGKLLKTLYPGQGFNWGVVGMDEDGEILGYQDYEPLFDAYIVPTIDPFFLMKEPDEGDDFMVDLMVAKRAYEGDTEEQAPIVIRDITRPEHIQRLIDETVADYPYLSYDFETDTGNRERAKVVTASFANGKIVPTENGDAYEADFWAGYDQLRPLYEEHVLRQFREAFDVLFSRAGTDYALIAHNANFDDWVAERMVGHVLPGSTYDTMLMKWQIDNKSRNGLKENTARYLGYQNYSGRVAELVNEIAKRRGKVLKDPIDLEVIRYFGAEPIAKVPKNPNKPTSYYWPKGLDKKDAAYALVPMEILRKYNAYDAVYTRLLFDIFLKEIRRQQLQQAAALRRRISRVLLRAEQRGFQCDVAYNRQAHTQLTEIVEISEKKIQEQAVALDPTLTDFNPNSNQDVAKLLFGDPVELPGVNADSVAEAMHAADPSREINWWEITQAVTAFEKSFYGDFSHVKAAIKAGDSDIYHQVAQDLMTTFKRKFGYMPKVQKVNYYFNGVYEPIAFTSGGQPSVASSILQTLYDKKPEPILALILMLRKAKKLDSTFVEAIHNKLDPKGVLRYRLNAIGTETGRISSSGPNCQNFPKLLRGQMIPRPGYVFVEWDLSQAEIRAVAAYSGDKDLIAALNSEDIHRTIASLVFEKPEAEVTDDERRYAKTIVFGIIYGMGAFRLAMALGITVEDAEKFINKFFNRFPGLKRWLDERVVLARKAPYKAKTPWGTQRSVRNVLSVDKKTRTHAERIAKNMPIQGAAGELTLYYICEIMDQVDANGWDVHLVNTTHDSCTLEVPEDMAWKINEKWWTVTDSHGVEEQKYSYEVGGPVADVINEVISTPAPVSPLDEVNFKADIELTHYWSKKPDVHKAIDPKYGTDKSKMRWDLIRPEDVLDREELEELRDVEQTMMGQ